jgi:hypothetical protein
LMPDQSLRLRRSYSNITMNAVVMAGIHSCGARE